MSKWVTRVIKNSINTLEYKGMENERRFNVQKHGLIIVSLFLAFIVFVATGCTGGTGGNNAPDALDAMAPASASSGGEDIIVEPGNKGAKPENAEKKSKKNEDSKAEADDVVSVEEDNMVAMVVATSGRANPFLPEHEAIQNPEAQAEAAAQERAEQERVLSEAKLKYDLVEPPRGARLDSDAQKVMTTKVSGIIYDVDSPSAILNIEGSDYLVRSGDVVNGYKILAIAKTVVTVQYGANVYKAGVGELLATDGINYNTISNLENKFGGSGRK